VYTYRKNSQPLGVSRSNGLTTTWGYDTLKMTMTQGLPGQGNVHAYDYQYDMKSNIAKRVEDGQPQTFGYDKLSRIQNASEYGESYTYDSRGNRLTLLSEKPLTLKEQSYQYDQKNRLTQVTEGTGNTVTYRYNGDGLLTERTEGGQTTRYYYDGAHIIAEGKVSGGTVTHKASYLRGTHLEARIDASGSKSYYVLNGHGDVVGLVDGAGQTLNTYTYDMWGAPVTTNESLPQPFRYSGELWDSSTGLQYLRARWYDPNVGRFINEDTYEGDITNPLSLNLYTYVKNNPLKYVDPSGHRPAYGAFDEYDPNLTYAGVMLDVNGYYTGVSYMDREWQAFKDIHSSPYSAIDYWTVGLLSSTQEYIQISKDDPLSVKQFASAAWLMMSFWPVGGFEKGAAELTGTVWSRITATQAVRTGTNIPTSFVLDDITINGNKLWVHGNATKHMQEYMKGENISMLSNDAQKMIEQSMLTSFESAIKGLSVKEGRNMYTINGWEIGINITEKESVIYHAVYRGN
jgi:RHS repeat-associated protein